MSLTLFNLLIFGTQRLKKGRREKALRAGAARGGRQDAKIRGAEGPRNGGSERGGEKTWSEILDQKASPIG
mgnify:CR=1 FL=1